MLNGGFCHGVSGPLSTTKLGPKPDPAGAICATSTRGNCCPLMMATARRRTAGLPAEVFPLNAVTLAWIGVAIVGRASAVAVPEPTTQAREHRFRLASASVQLAHPERLSLEPRASRTAIGRVWSLVVGCWPSTSLLPNES